MAVKCFFIAVAVKLDYDGVNFIAMAAKLRMLRLAYLVTIKTSTLSELLYQSAHSCQ